MLLLHTSGVSKVPAGRVTTVYCRKRLDGLIYIFLLQICLCIICTLIALVTRSRIVVAHHIYGVASTINSANYVYFLGLEKALTLNHPGVIKIYTGTSQTYSRFSNSRGTNINLCCLLCSLHCTTVVVLSVVA